MAGAEPAPRRPTLAVFASDRGPGDPERSSLMSYTGNMVARRRARLVSTAHDGYVAVPLITGARVAGGEVLIEGDDVTALPGALNGVPIERHADPEDRLRRVAALADLFVGLPGSLESAADLYKAWVRAGAGLGKPVVLFNRNRAFEVIRGLAADVLSHSVRRQDRMLVFTDNNEDLGTRSPGPSARRGTRSPAELSAAAAAGGDRRAERRCRKSAGRAASPPRGVRAGTARARAGIWATSA